MFPDLIPKTIVTKNVELAKRNLFETSEFLGESSMSLQLQKPNYPLNDFRNSGDERDSDVSEYSYHSSDISSESETDLRDTIPTKKLPPNEIIHQTAETGVLENLQDTSD